MKTALIFAAAIALSGCATGQYEAYAAAQAATAQARHNAEAERYRALAKIAESGSDTARVAAVMSLALGAGHGLQPPAQLAAPVPAGQTALQWASILVPGLTQAYGIHQNARLGIAQSNNAAATAQATTAGFVSIAGHIQAPAANVTTTNTDNSVRTDSTHTPTVVTQPAPLIVQPTL